MSGELTCTQTGLVSVDFDINDNNDTKSLEIPCVHDEKYVLSCFYI